MSYRYTVLGAGRQGVAAAFDLVKHGQAQEVTLVDYDRSLAQAAADKLNGLLEAQIVKAAQGDLSIMEQIRPWLEGRHATLSALPYFLNPVAAKAAILERTHFTDLGGNTSVVKEELELNEEACKAGISLLPDCGLAPGLSNLLAAKALSHYDETLEIHVRCGGIPVQPRPPFFYKMVFSIEGLLNEYSGTAIVIRDGKIQEIPALSECESVSIPSLGEFEAAVTTGGTSTAPESFLGKVNQFDYKTLRHPGHWHAIQAFADLGLFGSNPIHTQEGPVIPRNVLKALFEQVTTFPEDQDMVILRMEGIGHRKQNKEIYTLSLIDYGDELTGLSAMERTTAFPTSATAHLQVQGKIPVGARPIETCVPVDELLQALAKRGLNIQEEIQRL